MRILFLLAMVVFISACSSTYHTGYSANLQGCLSHLTAFKKEVRRQQVSDVQVLNHKAFPYLAFDRFSQSQLEQVTTDRDRSQWFDYTSQLATRQRQAEFNNLIVNRFDLQVLNHCADILVTEAKHNDRVWEEIIKQKVSVSDSYQLWLRVFGLYPLSRQVATSSIDKEKKRILLGFSEPPRHTASYRLAKTSLPLADIEAWFKAALLYSTSGWPILTDDQISQLYHFYSPLINVEDHSEDDIPGTVQYLANKQQPAVNPSKPAIYLHHSYTQLYGKTYLQLNYSLWFANRTPTSSFDPYAGKFDGVLLRLTLDHQGRPLLLDSIHHCGCYHMVFNLTDRFEFEDAIPDIETPLLFKRAVPSGSSSWSVTLSHGEHMIKQVTWKKVTLNQHDHMSTGKKAENRVHPLTRLDYDLLRQLPTDRHHTISLFNQRGLLPSSERLESTYLWPFGIPSAGAMRQLGHHAIAFVGIRHFDQPKLFEQLIRPVKP
ncbi:hypothetical protein LRP52_38895 [Photobacterium sp. ZSDE20]|uniref:Uncharacterized protein n=1 Tax=Photobacterium pectinilyticum TaxID=2906793 RepID=A0ABT1NAI5_9GAMM|nr:hypothetical protein [Photobacterium sp. ZSDE20]MCQ1060324.1 hypothetical protein [Photobacterium sp. ZSDE20]MDD1828151.1 hypothetical protein [Photobacterium sp. ZSDE20]